MYLHKIIKNVLKRRKRPSAFTLADRGRPGIPGGGEDVIRGKQDEKPPYEFTEGTVVSSQKPAKKAKDRQPDIHTPFGGMSEEKTKLLGKNLEKALDKTLGNIEMIFHAPRNADLIIRQFSIASKKGLKDAAVIFLNGMVDANSIKHHILRPLMDNSLSKSCKPDIKTIGRRLISETDTRLEDNYSGVVEAIVRGSAVLLVDGSKEGLSINVSSVKHRQVEESLTETVVRGPHTGFVEDFRVNISLIRQGLSTPDLVTETYCVGARDHKKIGIMYLESVVNPKLVDEVRKRIQSLSIDYAGPTALIENLIGRRDWDPFPSMLSTERPDKVAHMIQEGHVAIVGASPGVILAPSSVWDFMHSPEDYYLHHVVTSFLRLIRWLALAATLYASPFYIAIVNYHPEMVPTGLLFSIASARELVPFPAALEAFLMEIAFEIVREGGVRIPSVMGPTIGIVGAVVLGQAAVEANIVSPILVVVVAISGLGSFAIPNYNFSLTVRLAKYLMLLSSALLGIPGLTIGTILLMTRVFEYRSFGAPMMSPIIPWQKGSRDAFLKGPAWLQEKRPAYLRPKNVRRIKKKA